MSEQERHTTVVVKRGCTFCGCGCLIPMLVLSLVAAAVALRRYRR